MEGEMPAEKIASTVVQNGPDDSHMDTLRVQWGAKGGCPEAPDGWVNAGYAHLGIWRGGLNGYVSNNDLAAYVVLSAEDMDHLIRTMKRIRRQAFPTA